MNKKRFLDLEGLALLVQNLDNNYRSTVDNHYSPTSNPDYAISLEASSNEAADWDTTSLITGINFQRDENGHITNVTFNSVKMPSNPNTWRPVVDGLTSSATDESLSAAQGKWLNENKAEAQTLTIEDLNKTLMPGFYTAGEGNTVINKPEGIDFFGLEVIGQNAEKDYYTQILYSGALVFKRICTDKIWSNWESDNCTVNSKYSDGYVTKGEGHLNKVWRTDGEGNPSWRNNATLTIGSHQYDGSSDVTIQAYDGDYQ